MTQIASAGQPFWAWTAGHRVELALSFRVTTSAVLVVLAPTITHFGPIASAVDRVLEVAVGGTVGLLVSLLVFPARAHDLALQAAAATLDLMARLQSDLFAKLTHPIDEAPLGQLERSISEALARLDASSLEARHERVVRLGTEPDQGPLVRTVSRLRYDQIMIARAGLEPLPEIVQARLRRWLADIGTASAAYLQACAGALRTRRGPRPANAVMAALDGYAAEMAALRREGLTRELPSQSVEQVFTLSFALDQLRQHLADLERSVAELAASSTRSGQS